MDPALHQLLAENRDGTLKARHGFFGGFQVRGELRCGVSTFLRERLKLYGKSWKKSKKKNTASKQKGIIRVRGSNRRSGSAFHRHVYHAMFCRKRCDCKRAFGTQTKQPARSGTPCYRLVRQALQALGELKLKPVCGEQVIASQQLPVATQFDLLCQDTRDQSVLVSWKVSIHLLFFFAFGCCLFLFGGTCQW
jgi:hypothetical protein